MSNSSASLSEARDIDAELVSASRAETVVAKFVTSPFLALAFPSLGSPSAMRLFARYPDRHVLYLVRNKKHFCPP